MRHPLFRGPFSWARALGVPVVIVVAVFLDSGGLTLFLAGVLAVVAGAFRLVQGTWTVSTHPIREHRAVGVRKMVSGALAICGVGAAFAVFDASFDRAEAAGRRVAESLQDACETGARCPESLEEAGWPHAKAGWVYRFPLIYSQTGSGKEYILWVRAGIDEGTIFLGGRNRQLESCSRIEFDVHGCPEPAAND